jgi:hypothetical protein
MQSVTAQHAEFCTELVVNLYSGWIVQLVNASFAWRSHNNSFCYIVLLVKNCPVLPVDVKQGIVYFLFKSFPIN